MTWRSRADARGRAHRQCGQTHHRRRRGSRPGSPGGRDGPGAVPPPGGRRPALRHGPPPWAPDAGGRCVEQVNGPAGQEPAVLASFGHAPHHRRDPAAVSKMAQHPSYFLLVQTQHRGQVGHAGQGHPGRNPQQAYFIVVQRLPRRHSRTSLCVWVRTCGVGLSDT